MLKLHLYSRTCEIAALSLILRGCNSTSLDLLGLIHFCNITAAKLTVTWSYIVPFSISDVYRVPNIKICWTVVEPERIIQASGIFAFPIHFRPFVHLGAEVGGSEITVGEGQAAADGNDWAAGSEKERGNHQGPWTSQPGPFFPAFFAAYDNGPVTQMSPKSYTSTEILELRVKYMAEYRYVFPKL